LAFAEENGALGFDENENLIVLTDIEKHVFTRKVDEITEQDREVWEEVVDRLPYKTLFDLYWKIRKGY